MIEKLKRDGEGWVDEAGCFWNSKAEYIQIAILGFCGCGDPDAVMEYVRKMLLKLKRKEWETCEDRQYMFFVYWAHDKGFAEHGSNVCFSWLTTKGQELLRDIEEVGRG